MDKKASTQEFTEKETAKRRDEIMRRMIATPPKPFTSKQKKTPSKHKKPSKSR